jgi:hypothetical protein
MSAVIFKQTVTLDGLELTYLEDLAKDLKEKLAGMDTALNELNKINIIDDELSDEAANVEWQIVALEKVLAAFNAGK